MYSENAEVIGFEWLLRTSQIAKQILIIAIVQMWIIQKNSKQFFPRECLIHKYIFTLYPRYIHILFTHRKLL